MELTCNKIVMMGTYKLTGFSKAILQAEKLGTSIDGLKKLLLGRIGSFPCIVTECGTNDEGGILVQAERGNKIWLGYFEFEKVSNFNAIERF